MFVWQDRCCCYLFLIVYIHYLYNLVFFISYSLVTSDLLFYSSNLKQYSGFTDLDNRFDGLWTTVKEIKTKTDEENYKELINKQIDTKPKKFPHR